jgi:HEAT repeat protein
VRTRRARAAAARALRLIGSPDAVEALRDASTRGSRGVRMAARAELGQG